MNLFTSQHLETYDGRRVLLRFLVGSYNYNLEDESSDLDYKVFVLPSFDDLYNNQYYNKKVKIYGDDYEIKDIRLLEDLLTKANINYLEILVSQHYYCDPKFKPYLDLIFDNKTNIANANIKRLLDSMVGMAFEKFKAVEKDYPTQPNNEGYNRRLKYGFDTKQWMHVERLYILIINLHHNFDNTNLSVLDYIYLKNCCRKKLLDIKNNVNNYTKEQALFEIYLKIQTMKNLKDFILINNEVKTTDFFANNDFIKEFIRKEVF